MTFAMAAQSEEQFYVPQLGLAVTFALDAGRITGLAVQQGQQTAKQAQRISTE